MNAPLSFLLAALAVSVCPASNQAAEPARPKAVLVVRHAEKPETGPDLSKAGRMRADALPGLFKKSSNRPAPFPAPDFLFAAKASDESNRSVETLEPLARRLKFKMDDRVKNEDFAVLADKLLTDHKYVGKTVLVSWHHGKIPELLHALGVDPKPKPIGDGVFDRVWVVTYDASSKAKLTDRPQALMPMDTNK